MSLLKLWLTAGGHSLWEHIDGQPIPWRKAIWDQYALSDPRAEMLLIGFLLILPEETRQAAIGLRPRHFRNFDARAIWEGKSRPIYQQHALEELSLTSSAIVNEGLELHLKGERCPYHEAPFEQVVAALSRRLIAIDAARDKMREAEALLADKEAPSGGVPL